MAYEGDARRPGRKPCLEYQVSALVLTTSALVIFWYTSRTR